MHGTGKKKIHLYTSTILNKVPWRSQENANAIIRSVVPNRLPRLVTAGGAGPDKTLAVGVLEVEASQCCSTVPATAEVYTQTRTQSQETSLHHKAGIPHPQTNHKYVSHQDEHPVRCGCMCAVPEPKISACTRPDTLVGTSHQATQQLQVSFNPSTSPMM